MNLVTHRLKVNGDNRLAKKMSLFRGLFSRLETYSEARCSGSETATDRSTSAPTRGSETRGVASSLHNSR